MEKRTYAIWWRDRDGARRAGRLELDSSSGFVSGRGGERIPLDNVQSVEYAHGEIALHFPGETLRLGSLDAPGALREAALRLTERRDRGSSSG
jgi:hypothetical protein